MPGAATDVTISSSNLATPIAPVLAPTATVLGADMAVKSLTIADTASGLGLDADGHTLTIGAGGLTLNTGVPASTIAANVALGADQVWTNASSNPLTVSGPMSGRLCPGPRRRHADGGRRRHTADGRRTEPIGARPSSICRPSARAV